MQTHSVKFLNYRMKLSQSTVWSVSKSCPQCIQECCKTVGYGAHIFKENKYPSTTTHHPKEVLSELLEEQARHIDLKKQVSISLCLSLIDTLEQTLTQTQTQTHTACDTRSNLSS